MKFVRKFVAVLLLFVVILLLPASLLLKNTDDVLFTPKEMADLIDKNFLTDDIIHETIQSAVAPHIAEISTDSPLRIDWVNAWGTISTEDWGTLVAIIAPRDQLSALVEPTLKDISSWLESTSPNEQVTIDLRFLKENTASKTDDFSSFIIGSQREALVECSPEHTEFFFPSEITSDADVGLETPQGTNANLTIYQIIVTNENLYTPYMLDDMKIYALGENKRLSSTMSVPSCAAFIGKEIEPETEIRCKVDAQSGLIEDIKDTLEITATIIEPSDLSVCLPPGNYDPTINTMLEPVTSSIIVDTVRKYIPDEYSTKYFPAEDMEMVKKYTQQARQAAEFGWMAAIGLLLIGALIGSDKFKGFFAWLGIPLLLAGGILLGLNYTIKDTLWEQIAPMLGQGIPEYLKAPIQSFYDALLSLVTAPMMMQSMLILGAGLVALMLAFVFRSKKVRETVEENTEE